ncbi:uncharacterized protein LOC144470529 [Augochlora pura]
MFEFPGMKELLFATVLLSSAAYGDNDVVSDIRRAALSYLGTGEQEPRDNAGLDEDESLLTASRRTRGDGEISQHDSSNRLSPDKPGYHRCATSPATIASVNVRDLFEKKDQLSTYNSEICAYFREQGWKVENPMYVDEPTWIEIKNDYTNKLPLSLQFVDPYVLSRGKRIRWWRTKGDGKEDGVLAIVDDSKEADRVRRKRDYRTRLVSRSGPRPRRDLNIANSVAAKEKNSRILGQRNKHLGLQELFEQPYFISRGKKSKHRLNFDKLAEERIKSGMDHRLRWNYGYGDNDHAPNRFAETSESDSRPREADHFERAITRRRTKSSSSRKSVLDQLLTDSDLFYAGRGKRTSAALAVGSTESV